MSTRQRWCRPASAPATRSRSSMTEIADFVSRTRGAPAAAGQSRRAHRLQSQRHDGLVHQRDGHHQQRHHARDHPCRRRRGARARARDHGSSAGHAAHAVRDRHVEGLGQRARHHGRGRPVACHRRAADCSTSPSPARCRCSWSAWRSTCSSPRRSASSWRRSRAPCRSSGCSIMLVAVPLNLLSGANTPLESMPPLLAHHHAGVAVDALRLVCAGHPLSRRRLRHRMAADSSWWRRSAPCSWASLCCASAAWRRKQASRSKTHRQMRTGTLERVSTSVAWLPSRNFASPRRPCRPAGGSLMAKAKGFPKTGGRKLGTPKQGARRGRTEQGLRRPARGCTGVHARRLQDPERDSARAIVRLPASQRQALSSIAAMADPLPTSPAI